MASVLAGFRPVKHMSGAPYNGQFNRYMISASDGATTNVGDLVILSDQAALVDPNGGVYPAVERAGVTTSGVLVGAIVGFEPDYSNLNAGMYRTASTRRVAFVADSPDLVFACPQDGASSTVFAAADVGLNCDIVVSAGVTTAPYASTMMVDSSTATTTNTAPLRVVGVLASPDNDVTSTSRPAELLVMINTHQNAFGGGVTGAAGV